MKRLLTVLAASLIVLSLCSCKNENSAQSSSSAASSDSSISTTESYVSSENNTYESPEKSLPSAEEPVFSDEKDYKDTLAGKYLDINKLTDKTKKNVVDIINGDTLSLILDGNIAAAQGISFNFSTTVSKDGSKLYLSTTAVGRTNTILRDDTAVYSLDDKTKTASLLQKLGEESSGEVSPFYKSDTVTRAVTIITAIFGSNELSFVNSGNEDYDGFVYYFEEYKSGSTLIKLLYDGNTLKYVIIDKDGSESLLTIERLSAVPDDSLLELPKDYKVE